MKKTLIGKNGDTKRLSTLIDIHESGSSDFEYELFVARQKRKTALGAYRLALDQYIKHQ